MPFAILQNQPWRYRMFTSCTGAVVVEEEKEEEEEKMEKEEVLFLEG